MEEMVGSFPVGLINVFRATGIAVGFVLAGCVTPGSTAPRSLQVSEDQGLVAVKVASNRTFVSSLFRKWGMLEVRRVEDHRTVTMTNRSGDFTGHSLFIEPLPPGTYEITSVSNLAGGNFSVSSSA